MIDLAYGLPGTGKSTLLHDLVGAQSEAQLFLVNDHEAAWGYDGAHWRGKQPTGLGLIIGDEKLEELLGQPVDARPDSGVLVFRNVEHERILELAVHWGDCTYVDDELDKAGRKKGFDDSALRSIVNEGRHVMNSDGEPCEIHILGACRRPQKLHNDITDLADQYYLFRCKGSRTIDRLTDDDLIEDEDEAELKALPDFAFIHWPSGKRLQIPPLKPTREPFQP